MTVDQLEAWVLKLVDSVKGRSRVEDSRVELKAQWPEPSKAARRLAGHANAARCEHVLWVVGIDEDQGVVKTEIVELESWIAQVNAQFDGVAPSLVQDIIVSVGEDSVTALLFDATRRPFVVKNPAHGSPKGGPVAREVPWRFATSVRSARREDLIRVLVPKRDLPEVELLQAYGAVTESEGQKLGSVPQRTGGSMSEQHRTRHTGGDQFRRPTQVQKTRRRSQLWWDFIIELYVTPSSLEPLTIPTHRASFVFSLPNEPDRRASEIRFSRTAYGAARRPDDPKVVLASPGGAQLTGPDRLYVKAGYCEPIAKISRDEPLAAELAIIPARCDDPVRLRFELSPIRDPNYKKWNWKLTLEQTEHL